jgi:hypothetical protein
LKFLPGIEQANLRTDLEFATVAKTGSPPSRLKWLLTIPMLTVSFPWRAYSLPRMTTPKNMVRINRKSIGADISGISSDFDLLFCPVMALDAQGGQFSEHEGVVIAAMRLDVVNGTGWHDLAVGRTHPAQWLDLQLVRSPVLPTLAVVPAFDFGLHGNLPR